MSVSLSDEAYSPLNLPSRVPACAVVTGWIQALDEVRLRSVLAAFIRRGRALGPGSARVIFQCLTSTNKIKSVANPFRTFGSLAPPNSFALSLLMQRHAGGGGRLWGREFFLQLLDDGSVASRPPFLTLLGKLFFQLSALFHVAFPELDTLGFS